MTVLSETETLGLHIEGWMRFSELVWLFTAAQKVESVVEIGSWKGRSTYALLSGCLGPVYAVDHWLGSDAERNYQHKLADVVDIHAEFIANVGHFPNLVERRMSSAEAAGTINAADLVFIDSGHEYDEVFADINVWRPKATKILCGHDYDWSGVKRAVDDCFGNAVCNPAGNIWSVPVNSAFAQSPGNAFLFGAKPTSDFELQLREATDKVLSLLDSGWVLKQTPSAALRKEN